MGILSNIWRHWRLTILTLTSIIPILLVSSAASNYQAARNAAVTNALDYLALAVEQLVFAVAVLAVLVLVLAYFLRKLAIRVDKLEQAVVAGRN